MMARYYLSLDTVALFASCSDTGYYQISTIFVECDNELLALVRHLEIRSQTRFRSFSDRHQNLEVTISGFSRLLRLSPKLPEGEERNEGIGG
jgi:hypothetical protein